MSSYIAKPSEIERKWYILDAEPGARLVYGIDTDGENLRSIVEKGEL